MGNEVDNLEDQWVSSGISQNINFEIQKCFMTQGEGLSVREVEGNDTYNKEEETGRTMGQFEVKGLK